jgi:hypothetical protein
MRPIADQREARYTFRLLISVEMCSAFPDFAHRRLALLTAERRRALSLRSICAPSSTKPVAGSHLSPARTGSPTSRMNPAATKSIGDPCATELQPPRRYLWVIFGFVSETVDSGTGGT